MQSLSSSCCLPVILPSRITGHRLSGTRLNHFALFQPNIVVNAAENKWSQYNYYYSRVPYADASDAFASNFYRAKKCKRGLGGRNSLSVCLSVRYVECNKIINYHDVDCLLCVSLQLHRVAAGATKVCRVISVNVLYILRW